MTGETALIVNNVTKEFLLPHERKNSLKEWVLHFKKPTYERLHALQDVNLEVKRGEFFGIVGRNGSGKSTLLKIIGGIYLPSRGSITVNGSLTPFIELGIGFNPELTGRENVFLNGAILGLSRKEIASKYDEIVAFAELEKFMDQKLKNYSSGMQVRLAFSISIQAHNDILLIDEVLAVGDANFQRKCFNAFKDIKKQGKTVIFVTHDMGAIQEFCDRALMLKNGKVVQVDTPAKIAISYEIDNIQKTTGTDNKKFERLPDKGLRILDVQIDSGKAPKLYFNAKEDIRITIRYNITKPIPLYLGVSFRRTDDSYVAGYDTRGQLGEILEREGEHTITCVLPASQFAKDSYRVNASAFAYQDNELLDFIDSAMGSKTPTINIVEMVEGKSGHFNLSGKWIKAN